MVEIVGLRVSSLVSSGIEIELQVLEFNSKNKKRSESRCLDQCQRKVQRTMSEGGDRAPAILEQHSFRMLWQELPRGNRYVALRRVSRVKLLTRKVEDHKNCLQFLCTPLRYAKFD